MTKKAPIEWRNIRAPLSRVIPWEHNPKHISKDRAERLLKLWDDLGQFQTIAVGPGFELYDGHQRYNVLTAARGLDLEVDMRQSSRPLTKRERERLVVESHATATGSFDWDMLANEFDPKDLEAYGLTKEIAREWKSDLANLQALVSSSSLTENRETEITEDAGEILKRWKVKSGDLWRLGDHLILCGDCTDEAAAMRLMGKARASICFTSPPYNLGDTVSLRNGQRKTRSSAYNNSADSVEWRSLIDRFFHVAVSICDYVAVNLQILSGNKRDLFKFMGDNANAIADVAIWKKTNPQPAMAEKVFTSSFEIVLVMSGDDKPSRSIRSASFDRGSFSNFFESSVSSDHDASIHGAVFPIEFATHFVGGLSSVGDIVYEPFAGSGTTLIACERLGRKCRAIEISPEYVALTLERWHVETGKTPNRVS